MKANTRMHSLDVELQLWTTVSLFRTVHVVSTKVPSGEKEAKQWLENTPSNLSRCATKVFSQTPLAVFHIFAVMPTPDVSTNLPSNEKDALLTQSSCPDSIRKHAPPVVHHILAGSLKDVVRSSVPSGENITHRSRSSRYPANVLTPMLLQTRKQHCSEHSHCVQKTCANTLRSWHSKA